VFDAQKHVLPNKNGTYQFNALVNHAVFNKKVMTDIVPNAKYIGE